MRGNVAWPCYTQLWKSFEYGINKFGQRSIIFCLNKFRIFFSMLSIWEQFEPTFEVSDGEGGICGLQCSEVNGFCSFVVLWVPFLCHIKALGVGPKGVLAWPDQTHFRAPFHVWHSILSLTGSLSWVWAPSPNYRSPCQQRGPDQAPLTIVSTLFPLWFTS